MDELPGEPIANEARQAQICGAGNDAFLARRQRHIGVGRRDDVVHDEQRLAVTADCKIVEGGDPGLLNARPVDVVRQGVRACDAAEHLVHIAEVALYVPDEGYLAAIEVGQVDAGAENAPAVIFGMIDLAAADDGDFCRRIKDRDVDCNLHLVQRRPILGVQVARIGGGEIGRDAAALDPHRPEFDYALDDESLKMLLGIGPRQQHGVTEMQSAPFATENMREQEALIDLQPVLVALKRASLPPDFGARRRQPGKSVGRGKDEVFDANEAREVIRQRSVDLFHMRAEKTRARSARALVDRLRGLCLGRLARRFSWKAFDQRAGERPEDRIATPVFAELSGSFRLGRDPMVDCRRRQAAIAQGCAKRPATQRLCVDRRHVLALKSMTRLALPCERSIVPGGTIRALAVTPT